MYRSPWRLIWKATRWKGDDMTTPSAWMQGTYTYMTDDKLPRRVKSILWISTAWDKGSEWTVNVVFMNKQRCESVLSDAIYAPGVWHPIQVHLEQTAFQVLAHWRCCKMSRGERCIQCFSIHFACTVANDCGIMHTFYSLKSKVNTCHYLCAANNDTQASKSCDLVVTSMIEI